MFRIIGLIIGVLTGLVLTGSVLLDFLFTGAAAGEGDIARGGIAISSIAGLVCGLAGYIIGAIIDSVRKKKSSKDLI